MVGLSGNNGAAVRAAPRQGILHSAGCVLTDPPICLLCTGRCVVSIPVWSKL